LDNLLGEVLAGIVAAQVGSGGVGAATEGVDADATKSLGEERHLSCSDLWKGS